MRMIKRTERKDAQQAARWAYRLFLSGHDARRKAACPKERGEPCPARAGTERKDRP